MTNEVRWGILGTARIAQTAFMPALGAAGGRAVIIGGRDQVRAEEFAKNNGIDRASVGYDAVIHASDVDAVYVPLPNSLHGEWTVKALKAGKAVLCEKPLCGDVEQARKVLAVARSAERPLWEAFVFPYHRQHRRIMELLDAGAIGRVAEIHSEFHFHLRNATNIRLDAKLGGGGLNDVGCYPVRLAQLVFRASPLRGVALARSAVSGVDEEAIGAVEYANGGRLLISCGMRRDSGTFTRIVGDDGEVRITNPFHARDHDTVEIRSRGTIEVEKLGTAEPTFAEAIRHIQRVLTEEAAPEHTAIQDTLHTEAALDCLRRSAISGQVEGSD